MYGYIVLEWDFVLHVTTAGFYPEFFYRAEARGQGGVMGGDSISYIMID